MAETTTTAHKTRKIGQVVSSNMKKTIVVEITRRVSHPFYKRIVTKRKKFYAHDEKEVAKTGDTVEIVESRPLSRLKRWTLSSVVRRAVQVGAEPTEEELVSAGAKKPRSKAS